jgi:hypothetical protein
MCQALRRFSALGCEPLGLWERPRRRPLARRFFIDPKGVLRAMVYYPMTNGRSIEEFLRLLKALQTSDARKVETPEGWTTGEKVLISAPLTAEAIAARMADATFECTDWYFCKRELSVLTNLRTPLVGR